MSARQVKIAAPPHVDHAKLLDARFTIAAEGPNGKCLVHYDPEQAVGALYLFESQVWSIWGPLAFGAWASSLQSRGIIVREGTDLQTWLDATASEIAHGELN
jgi:hypothetical protein